MTGEKLPDHLERAALQLGQAASAGALVVIVGSGASAEKPSTLPTWGGFADLMIAEVAEHSPSRAALMKEEAAAGDFVEVANLFERINLVSRREFFSRTFSTSKDSLPSTQRLLAALPARHWLTTNFDPYLRFALADKNPSVEVLNNSDEDLRAVLSLWSRRSFAVHLHGKADLYESLVFSKKTFDAIQKRAAYRELVKRAFTECTVLMYGYSCTDPDVLSVIRYVAEELGGAGERVHYLVTSRDAANADLLRAANVEVLRYSPADGHAEAKRFLGRLCESAAPPSKTEVLTVSKEKDLVRLVRVFLSLNAPHERATTYQTACASLVLSAIQATNSTAPKAASIHRIMCSLAHVDSGTADRMLAEGLSLLAARKRVRVADDAIELVQEAQQTLSLEDPVVTAIETRALALDSSYRTSPPVKDAIRRIVTHVMMAQGMTVARSYLNEEDVGGYDLQALLDEAFRHEPRPPVAVDRTLRRAIAEVLRDPDVACAKGLFELANAAYSLELLFLNPLEAPLWNLLQWKVFLDSNVALRLVSPVSRFHGDFANLVSRCRRIGVPIAMLHPFAEECVAHAEKVAAVLDAVGAKNVAALKSYVESVPERERSPILEWYYVAFQRALKPLEFRRFLSQERLSSVAEWTALLWEKYGVTVEEPDITRKVDTSERETLWADLREWREDQSHAGRSLRRNEATQVEWMLRLRDQGTRTWFLSIDNTLRRALVTLRRGQYAGFVMPPATLAQHLTNLHWGEVDLSGFSALMWTMPKRSPRERATDMILRDLASRSDSINGVEPEWLRDQVENIIRDGTVGTVIPSGLWDEERFAEQEASFVQTMQDVLPKTVERILDQLAKLRSTKPQR